MTHSFRALYPDWSPDGKQIVFVAHQNSIANLYAMNSDGSNQQEITHFDYDTQIMDPQYSPDGQSVVFAMADHEANLDLFLLTLKTGEMRRLTNDPAADYGPVWHPNGKEIIYTSHTGSTPNLHSLNLTTDEHRQITDVGDAVWTAQWSVIDSSVMATTLPDVDTVRIVNVNPERTITTENLVLREKYTDWRHAGPDTLLKNINPKKEVDILKSHPYSPFIGIKHMTSLVLPLGNSIVGMTQWVDAMTRHIVAGVGVIDLSQHPTHRLALSYTNAMGGPMWGMNVSSLLDIKSRPYDRTQWGILEENKSISLWARMPVNLGNNLSDNHLFGGRLKLTDRHAKIIEGIDEQTGDNIYADTTRFLPMPVSGREGLIGVFYTWVNRRPNKLNTMNPKQGYGIHLEVEYANSGLFGDFDYTRMTTDMFFNFLPHKKSPAVIFARLKSVTMLGQTPPPQDLPAITNDTPIYIGGNNILGTDEVVHLRGWNEWRSGDRLVFGTVEPRFGNEKFTAAVFLDFGNAWVSGENMEDWLFTGGYEIRANLLGFIIAYGTAQDFNRWRENKIPVNYLRLSLVNPF